VCNQSRCGPILTPNNTEESYERYNKMVDLGLIDDIDVVDKICRECLMEYIPVPDDIKEYILIPYIFEDNILIP